MPPLIPIIETHPELCKELAPRSAEAAYTLSRGSGTKAWWTCSKGHDEWLAPVKKRTSGKRGCPECSRQYTKITDPVLVREYIGKKPLTEYSAGSNVKVWWKCTAAGHEWEALINNRSHGNGCPECAKASMGDKRMQRAAEENPITDELMLQEYRGKLPITTYSKSSNVVVQWECSVCETRWKAAICDRSRGRGCRVCHQRKLASENPITDDLMIKEYRGIEPITTYAAGANKMVPWECSSCGHYWIAPIFARTQGKGCQECGLKKMAAQNSAHAARKNPITNPILLRECLPPEITNFSPWSKQEMPWKCTSCSHTWTATIAARSKNPEWCPKCNHARSIRNQLLIDEYIGDIPLLEYKTSSTDFGKWKCSKCEHIWHARFNARSMGRGRCPNCMQELRRQKIIAHALATNPVEDELLILEYRGTQPLSEYSAGMNVKVLWECSGCHNQWIATIRDRASKDTGCPDCCSTGYNSNSPGTLYLISDELLEVGKIGISNTPSRRLEKLAKCGLITVHETWDFPVGSSARKLEHQVLAMLRSSHGMKSHPSYTKDGYSETFSIKELSETPFLNLHGLQALIGTLAHSLD